MRPSARERATLRRWAAGSDDGPAVALRAAIVLACADGGSNSAVADRLGVSVPTVRKWRGRFAERGLDGLRAGGRPGRPPRQPGPVAFDTSLAGGEQLWEAVAARLREAILSGTLPAGTSLVETDLAERFGTSRGPVREAIRELTHEGLVVELSRRAAVVSTPTGHDLTEVYEARRGLELVAAEAAIGLAADDAFDVLDEHLDAFERTWARDEPYLAGAEHDLAFHRALVALAANGRIASMYEQLLSQTAVLLHTAAAGNPRLREGMRRDAHRDIVAALRARDVDAARAAVDAHYRYALDRLHGSPAAAP